MAKNLSERSFIERSYYKLSRALRGLSIRKIEAIYRLRKHNPVSFRLSYYSYLKRLYRRSLTLPSPFALSQLPASFDLELAPTIRQLLLRSTHSPSLNEAPIVNLYICQSWDVFRSSDLEILDEATLNIDGVCCTIHNKAAFAYPSQLLAFKASVERDPNTLTIVFVYAYMLEEVDFMHCLLDLLCVNSNILLGVFFSDSHHMPEFCFGLSLLADFIVSCHPDNYQLLSSCNPFVYIDKIYLNQWSSSRSLDRLRQGRFLDRDFSLYGRHNYHPQFPRRNRFLSEIPAPFNRHLRLNSSASDPSWFKLTSEQALTEWHQYAISCVVPTRYDLTTRVFDAMSAGHAVLVPRGCTWLDHWIPLSDQQHLGIYRYDDYSWPSLHQCYSAALMRERSSDAQERAIRRSTFVDTYYSQRNLLLKITEVVNCLS